MAVRRVHSLKCTVVTHEVFVVGRGWHGQPMATTYNLIPYGLENLGEFTRDNVQKWLDTHAGDFQVITDFSASLAEVEIPFATEEGELAWYDLMFDNE